MEEDSNLLGILRRNLLPVGLGIAGLIFVGSGLMTILGNKESSSLKFEASETTEMGTSSASGVLVVDIAGGVEAPGIYELKLGARIHDLLVASGGLSEEADRDFTSKNINLAAKLSDGQKVYIPRIGESILNAASTNSSISTGSLIDMNSASSKDLDSLPGIGPVTAQKIIDNRPYLRLEDLLTKKVLSSSVFDKIKEQVTAN